MKSWDHILQDAQEYADTCGLAYFRGQADENWSLLPRLARRKVKRDTELRIFLSFRNLGLHLFPSGVENPWDQLALMQHHGLPTRLLDWTETFGIALYFAMCEPQYGGAAVWMLNPFKLNGNLFERDVVMHLNENSLGCSYFDLLPNADSSEFSGRVAAVVGQPYSTRMRSQRGAFTMHFDLEKPLEKLSPDSVKKIVIPKALFPEAKRFLRLGGINNFSLFQDLDALGRYIKGSYF